VAAGKRVTLPDVGLFSDGTAVKLVGEETFRIARGLVDEFMTVDTDAVCAAIKDVFVDTRSIVEPAGRLAVAAIKQYVATHKTEGETYAAILCGANMNFDRLRFVAERAEVGEEREALLAVTIPEERGSFRRFCEVIGELPGGPRNVTEFNYRISDAAKRPCVCRPDHARQGRIGPDRATSAATALKRWT
jgi:threonine dehydratase